jgi:hypothetical protein
MCWVTMAPFHLGHHSSPYSHCLRHTRLFSETCIQKLSMWLLASWQFASASSWCPLFCIYIFLCYLPPIIEEDKDIRVQNMSLFSPRYSCFFCLSSNLTHSYMHAVRATHMAFSDYSKRMDPILDSYISNKVCIPWWGAWLSVTVPGRSILSCT